MCSKLYSEVPPQKVLTMTRTIEATTKRLLLRQWQADDRAAFAAMTADPVVMEFFQKTLSRTESDALADRIEGFIDSRGWGFWTAQLLETGEFIGFIGLHRPRDILPFSPCVEIGWRLARPFWGQGYATEGAAMSLKVGFEQLGLDEIVSFAVVNNYRSRAVMEKIKMIDSRQNFEHPEVAETSPLREHCLYKISKQAWLKSNA